MRYNKLQSMIKNIFFIFIGFLLGVFLTSSLSWRDIDWNNLKHNPFQELMRLRSIVSNHPKPEANALFVTKVINGNLVIVEGGKEVRLLGIIADEKGEPCYEEAKKRLEDLVLGKKVTMIKDVNDKNEKGQLLRYLIIDGKNVNVELVKEGLVSLLLSGNVKMYKTDFNLAEQYAKNKSVGCKWEKKKSSTLDNYFLSAKLISV